MGMISAGKSHLMSLLGTPTHTLPSHLPTTIVRVNKQIHQGSGNVTKQHRRELKTKHHDPLAFDRYGGDPWRDPARTSAKLERRNEGAYAAKNLHEYV